MSKRGDLEFLIDIREATRRIELYTEQMDYEEFLEDIKTQDSVVHNLETMGEATKNLSENIRKKYPEIPWKDWARVRDKLIHHYFGINYDIVWGIVKEELPKVIPSIKKIINCESETNT